MMAETKTEAGNHPWHVIEDDSRFLYCRTIDVRRVEFHGEVYFVLLVVPFHSVGTSEYEADKPLLVQQRWDLREQRPCDLVAWDTPEDLTAVPDDWGKYAFERVTTFEE